MKRIIILSVCVAVMGGCGKPNAKPILPRATEANSAQGVIDGYLSVYPNRPYTRDTRSKNAYRQGWNAGRQIGLKDELERR